MTTPRFRTRPTLLALFASGALLMTPGLHAWASLGHVWGTNQVGYYVNPSNTAGLSDSAVIGALNTASSAWSTQSNANFSFYYAGATSGSTAQYNAKNEIFFRPDPNGWLAAVTYYWSDMTTLKLLDTDTVIFENDFAFFTGTSGCANGLYLEDVMTHEFGHALGLDHSALGSATMYPTVSICAQDMRSLDVDDITAVETLYPSSGPSLPAAPTALFVTTNAASPTSSLALTWLDAATNEDGYRVERSPNGTSFSQIAQLGRNAQSYADSGLASGTTYFYRVSAYNTAGSRVSNIASGQTDQAAPTCTRANPSVTLSPQAQSILAGGTASYTVSLKNMDSSGCGASSFTLQQSIPTGWSDVLGTGSLTVNPGATSSTSWQVTSPPSATAGVYPDGVTGINGTSSMTSTMWGSVSIGTPQPPVMTVQVGTNGKGGNYPLTATIKSGTAPISGVRVTFVVTDPTGKQSQYSATTGTTGQANTSLRLKGGARGTYSVSASATVNGTALTATTQFVL